MVEIKDYLVLLKEFNNKTEEMKHESNYLIDFISNYVYEIIENIIADNKFHSFYAENLRTEIKSLEQLLINARVESFNFVQFVLNNLTDIEVFLDNDEVKRYIEESSFYESHKLAKYTHKKLHQTICRQIFKNIECTNGKDNYFWVQINQGKEGLGEKGYINLNVLSYDVIKYDSFIFSLLDSEDDKLKSIAENIYRPYFIDYYIKLEELTSKQSDFLLSQENQNKWFNAYFSECLECSSDVRFDGVYATSASPIQYKNKKLVITDTAADMEALNKINATYSLNKIKCCDEKRIKREIEKIFKNMIFTKVDIYKVGNANCIYSHAKGKGRKRRLFFDIGFELTNALNAFDKKMPNSYGSVLKRIIKMKPHCIIISHWHEDHFKACAYGNDVIFNCQWIAPDLNAAAANAKRLGIYLYKKDKMIFVDRNKHKKIKIILIPKKSELVLYVGKDNTNLNTNGIALLHKNTLSKNIIRCLMMGDVPYESLPNEANFVVENPYEYLVAPHHGAEMNVEVLSSSCLSDTKAVICCDNNIRFNSGLMRSKEECRPAKKHIEKLSKCYGEIKTTEEAQVYIEFNLLKKGEMQIK